MERVDVLIAGAGPAGLAVAACLTQRGIPFVIVEAGASVGTSWHGHYDRLHLHTTKAHSALPGLPFSGDVPLYPSRSQVIAYLESYAVHVGITPRFHERLERARPLAPAPASGAGWDVQTSAGRYHARHLVMATGLNRKPVRPARPGQERFRGQILHSADYRTGASFRGKRALVVGMGNTGAEIALDLHEHGARVTLSVRNPTNILPREFLGVPVQVTALRTAFLPVRVKDLMGQLTSRMAFGDLSPYGLPAPAYGPATQMVTYGRTPVLDIGTIARIRPGDIDVVPGIETFTESDVRFVNGSRRELDVIVLATGYHAALEELIEAPEVSDGQRSSGLHLVGYRNAMTGLLRQIRIEAELVARTIAAGPQQ